MNSFLKTDTIAAISTPQGIGGVHLLRISGKNSRQIVDKYFDGKNLLKMKSHTLSFGKFHDNETIIDEVLVSIFKSPNTFTGEDIVEISCHGNYFIAKRILETLLKDLRLAEPGEFTKRAFINNRIDLTKAEAIGDLLEAQTKASHQLAINQLEGKLYSKINNLVNYITDLRTLLELEIDFVEQGLESLNQTEFLSKLTLLQSRILNLIKSGDEGLIIKDGLKIALVGAPNVGKSSIFNKFLQSERAIVTPIPGTTRDYLEESIAMNGFLIKIFDTAGIRKTDDKIEILGIERSIQIIRKSHLVFFISDFDDNKNYEKLSKIISKEKIWKIANKSDKMDSITRNNLEKKNYILTNTVYENGMDDLKKKVLNYIKNDNYDIDSGILTNLRQITAVKKALQSLNKAINSFKNNLGYEFTAFDLKETSEYLEEIIGKVTNEDILANIFSNFCVGK
jgi:tRNA modification GTPase